MKIYNEDKTRLLNSEEVDFEKGYLKADKLLIAHHEATPLIKGKTAQEIFNHLSAQGLPTRNDNGKYYKVTATYDSGGEDVEEIESEEDIPAKEAWDEYEEIQVYVAYNEEELKEHTARKRIIELKAELVKIKEDIEQEIFGLVRDDYAEKKARAAEIVNELRILEGKEPRKII